MKNLILVAVLWSGFNLVSIAQADEDCGTISEYSKVIEGKEQYIQFRFESENDSFYEAIDLNNPSMKQSVDQVDEAYLKNCGVCVTWLDGATKTESAYQYTYTNTCN